MKAIQITLLYIFAISVNTQAQTADEIIGKWMEAMGGKAKLNSIHSLYTENNVSIMGNQASGLSYTVDGNGYRTEIDFNGQKVITTVTDKNGWSINPLQGQTKPESLPEDQVISTRPELFIAGPLFDYQAKGYKAILIGKDSLDGLSVYHIKLNTDSVKGPQMDVYLDAVKFYVLKIVRQVRVNGQNFEIDFSYNNYKLTEFGNIMAFTQDLDLAGLKITTEYKIVKINQSIDSSLFALPK
jgi:hypothetical protein